MFCVFNHKADCFDCGNCHTKKENRQIWEFEKTEGQEEFLEDLWQFIFSSLPLPKHKSHAISIFLQGMLERSETKIIEYAKKNIA